MEMFDTEVGVGVGVDRFSQAKVGVGAGQIFESRL